jgi:hypothetical protein
MQKVTNQIIISAGSGLECERTSGPNVSALPLQLSDDRDQLVSVLSKFQEIQVKTVGFVRHLGEKSLLQSMFISSFFYFEHFYYL